MKGDKASAVARTFAYRFRARHDALDSFGHLNNAVCVKYMQEAAIQASSDAGYSLQWYEKRAVSWVIHRLEVRYYLQVRYGDDVQVRTWLSECGHDIEYFGAARDNDEIEIVSWICEVGKVRAAWTHEIYQAETMRLLARDYSLGVFVNRQGRPIATPSSVVDDILRGPADRG
jgi:acyl-CoA thioesterase FadM